MGGTAVFPTYALNQNLFKAVASFSGRPYSYGSEHIEALKSAKFFIFGGRKDNICKIEDTEKLVRLMQDAGIKADFYIDEESGHTHPSRIFVDKYLGWLDSIINQ
jgi:predicted esterase